MAIQLFVAPAGPEVLNYSPPCMKVEIWMRLADLPYEATQAARLADLRRAPKGKVPYIVDGDDVVADSEFIIAFLSRKYAVDLDRDLTLQQRAVSRALERMLDEHTYWCLVYFRYVDPEDWAVYRRALRASSESAFLRIFCSVVLRPRISRYLWAQGLGRHTAEEICQRLGQDWAVLSDILGEQEFLMGHRPTTVDACAYSYIANMRRGPVSDKAKAVLARFPNLIAYATRMDSLCALG